MPVVTRFHAEARRLREFLGRALSSAKVSDLRSKLTGRLRHFDGQGGMIDDKNIELKWSKLFHDLLKYPWPKFSYNCSQRVISKQSIIQLLVVSFEIMKQINQNVRNSLNMPWVRLFPFHRFPQFHKLALFLASSVSTSSFSPGHSPFLLLLFSGH